MKHYLTGFAVSFAVMVLINLIPYLTSLGAYKTDGFEIAGIPFSFWRMGGNPGVCEFKLQFLIADIAVALGVSTVAGGLWREQVRQYRN